MLSRMCSGIPPAKSSILIIESFPSLYTLRFTSPPLSLYVCIAFITSRAGSEAKFKGGLAGNGEMKTKYHIDNNLKWFCSIPLTITHG